MKISKLQRRIRRASRLHQISAGGHRLRVFRSLRHTYAQLINPDGQVLVAISSNATGVPGTKTDRAHEAGKVLAKKIKKLNIKNNILFDRAGYRYHGRIKALAEGARQAGLQF